LQTEDATSIWVAQFSGGTINVIDSIQGVSQPLGYYVNELRSRGFNRLGASCRMTA
jgi:hypothetical protein